MMKMRICQYLISRGVSAHQSKNYARLMSTRSVRFNEISQEILEEFKNDDLPETVHIAMDKRIIYSSYISQRRIKLDDKSRNHFLERYYDERVEERKKNAVPLIVEKLISDEDVYINENETETQFTTEKESRVSLPYSTTEDIDVSQVETNLHTDEEDFDCNYSKMSVKEHMALRLEAYEQHRLKTSEDKNQDLSGQEELLNSIRALEDEIRLIEKETPNFGAFNPNVPVSDVACGGCGAMLHCQDYALPGFLPVELFEGKTDEQLRKEICQRCYFLKHHNMALNVRVSPSIYKKLLEPIKDKIALVIVVIDLLDVPCSIWPNIIDIIGTRRPVVIVGNKVDLLPADGRNHLGMVKDSLMAAVDNTALGRANIKDTFLVSAYTGFGVESLITKIQNSWGIKGDIYLLGCTNSGKSTLFNALLGSDLCKTTATDLIQRATTSPWPGTTLNMLKFPVLRPNGYRLHLRTLRLQELQRKKKSFDKNIEYTTDYSLATLSGHIGRTFVKNEITETLDPFSIKAEKIPNDSDGFIGIKESNVKYSEGKWCYDTPGTVQPDQMINLLTHEELIKVLPRKLIQPRTYTLLSGRSLFIGGLARLDLLYSSGSIKFTVFASPYLPITVVRAVDASAFYRDYLGTPLLGIPTGNDERLQLWPVLVPRDLRMTTESFEKSGGDVVLSSAGWITLTAGFNHIIEMRAWTPGGRGIYLRSPSMLPRIASLRGPRVRNSPAYKSHKFIIPRVSSGDENV